MFVASIEKETASSIGHIGPRLQSLEMFSYAGLQTSRSSYGAKLFKQPLVVIRFLLLTFINHHSFLSRIRTRF